MALEIKRELTNGAEANYHVILKATLDISEGYFNVVWGGMKDKDFRSKAGKTEYVSMYIESLNIEGKEFETMLPELVATPIMDMGYKLMKERISYLKDSKEI